MEELIRKLDNDFFDFFYKKKPFKNYKTAFKLPAEEILVEVKALSLNKDLLYLYSRSNGFEVTWDFDRKNDLLGRMKILPIESVINGKWEDSLADAVLEKKYRPIDLFVEEASCGILLDGSGNQEMFYNDLGSSDLYSLDLDFKSYFELAIEARVFRYWQYYIVSKIHGYQGVKISFPEDIKKVFPDFDLEAFDAKFESLRLSKRK